MMLAKFLLNTIQSILVIACRAKRIRYLQVAHIGNGVVRERERVSGREISKLLLVPASTCRESTTILLKGRSIYLDNISLAIAT